MSKFQSSSELDLQQGLLLTRSPLSKVIKCTTHSTIPPETPLPKKSYLDLLHTKDIDAVYREPYIITGYRQTGTTVWECIKYTSVCHNDVGNFWTHFIPLLIWLMWFVWLAKYSIDFTQPYYYPLLCFWIGSCSYVFFSSMAHMFSCKSFTVRTVCFILDYLGIAMYGMGGGIVALFYLQPANTRLFPYKHVILAIEVLFAILSTLMCGLTRFYWKKYRFILRILSFVFPYLSATFPFAYRFFTCLTTGHDCVYETLHLHFMDVFLTISLTAFFVTKLPERLSPGRFDNVCQSHQLFHIFAVALTSLQMYFMPWEAELRSSVMKSIPGSEPDWSTTAIPLLATEVLGLVVVVVMGYLTVQGVLTTNKTDTTVVSNGKDKDK